MVNAGELYGEPDTLMPFSCAGHCDCRAFMSPRALVRTAIDMAERIASGHFNTIVYLESGSAPLAALCRRLIPYTTWIPLKVPRRMPADWRSIMKCFLRDKTMPAAAARLLSGAPDSLCPDGPPKALDALLSSLSLRESCPWQLEVRKAMQQESIGHFKGPVLLFDEYVDSGCTINNAVSFLTCFLKPDALQVLCYFLNSSIRHSIVFDALYDATTREACLRGGAYPFENRIDLIGYLYFESENGLKRLSLEELGRVYPRACQPVEIDYCGSLRDLAAAVRERASIAAVARFIDERHILRHLFADYETKQGCRAFLEQMFDMYGPIWSPLPDAYHLDFLNAFALSTLNIRASDAYEYYRRWFSRNRKRLIGEACAASLKRRRNYLNAVGFELETVLHEAR